ncbi:hypothetical protein ColTof3_03774 [Colletotrichum tofieldiae]|nr:hypothetical protein ColTof3_03774 [Colletotrichum tofieldiae]GKT87648.1 hypothetical protein Ct61P_05498 [Colletotrichum tofieldiae]
MSTIILTLPMPDRLSGAIYGPPEPPSVRLLTPAQTLLQKCCNSSDCWDELRPVGQLQPPMLGGPCILSFAPVPGSGT